MAKQAAKRLAWVLGLAAGAAVVWFTSGGIESVKAADAGPSDYEMVMAELNR